MKAKDYAKIFIDGGKTEDVARGIAFDFVMEAKSIADDRNATSDPAFYSIFNELNDKWKSFCRLVDGEITQAGFRIALHAIFPDVIDGWDSYNRGIGK